MRVLIGSESSRAIIYLIKLVYNVSVQSAFGFQFIPSSQTKVLINCCSRKLYLGYSFDVIIIFLSHCEQIGT